MLLFDVNSPSLPLTWVSQMAIQIVEGNRIHDNVTGQQAINFSVEDAIPHVRENLGNITIEEPLDLEFCLENVSAPHSSVAFYLQRLPSDQNVAAVVIINDQTISFVGSNQGVILVDSHRHGNYGALVAQTNTNSIEDFLLWLRAILSPRINLCTLTFIQFHN